MKKYLKKPKSRFRFLASQIAKIFLVIVVSLYSASPVFAQTTEWSGVCISGTITDASGATIDAEVATIQGLECLIANVFTVVISLIGFSAFVMLIVGSVQWLVSGGSVEGTKKARNTLTYAVLGIVVALSAFIVLNLIAGFTGVDDIKQFIIPGSEITTE